MRALAFVLRRVAAGYVSAAALVLAWQQACGLLDDWRL